MTGLPNLNSPLTGSPSVSSDTSRLATSKNLEAAGQKFEAVFTGMMLKAMRSTHLAEDLFGSKAQDQFRDMWDDKMVQSMAVHTPLGIGKAMTDFLSRNNAALAQPAAATTPVDPAGKGVVNPDTSERAP